MRFIIKITKLQIDRFESPLLNEFRNAQKHFGKKIAIVDGCNKYSYEDVYNLSKVVAYKLKSKGIKKGDYVSLDLPASAAYYFARFGAWMLGAVVICLSDKTPAKRRKEIANICNTKCFIDKKFIKEALYENTQIDNSEIIENSLEDPAFAIFTSGSTGKPKGVLHSHKSATYIIKRQIINAEITKAGNHACNANPEFIAFSGCDFVPIFFGGTLYIVPENIREDYKQLSEFIVSNKINSLLLPASFVDNLNLKGNKLDYVIVAGSKVTNLYSKDFIIYNTYGASETGGLLYFKIDKKYENTPLGKGSKSGKMYLVEDGELQKDFGEMWFAGNIFEGYLNSPKESKNVRIKNPFKNLDGFDYVYKTGDYGRRLSNGNIVFAGRADFMTKINGQRVEPSEIESRLNKLKGIEESVVKPFHHKDKDYLCAYYVAKNKIDEEEIRNNLLKVLPKYMVPSFYVYQKSFKRNKNGKVEYKLLKAPEFSSINSNDDIKLNKTEEFIVSCFSKTLSLLNISLDDDFIKLGGTSVEAIKIANLVSNPDFHSYDVLRLRSPKKIANYIENLKQSKYKNNTYNMTLGRPLTAAQLSIYLDIQMLGKSNAYTLYDEIFIGNKYSLKQVKNSLEKLIKKHAELKGRIDYKDNNLWLKFDAKPVIKSLSEKDVDRAVFEIFDFDLSKELSRFYISKKNKNLYVHAIFHHIIFDLYSFEIFKNDLFSLLNKKDIITDRSMFKSCAEKECTIDKYKKDVDKYLNSAFSDLENCEKLLSDSNSDESYRYKIKFKLDSKALNKLIIENNTSLGSYFTSMFAFALSKFTGSQNVQFCITTSGRDNVSNDNAVGMYANTFPVMFNCDNRSLRDFLTHCNNSYYQGLKYQDFPLHEIKNKLNIDAQTVFQYVPFDENIDKKIFEIKDGKNSICYSLGAKQTMNDLIVYVVNKNNFFIIDATFSGKFSPNKIQSFLNSYILIVKNSLQANFLSDINYCEQKKLKTLEQINSNDLKLKFNDIIEVFDNNVRKFPNNPCVTYEDTTYTYKEVDYITNYLAKQISKLRISNNQCVSFISKRSHWYLINLIALLKAAVIYVPIDEGLPANRIDFMLKSSDSKAVIVSKDLLEENKTLNNLIKKQKNVIIVDERVALDAIKNRCKFNNKIPDKYYTSGIVYTSGTTGEPKGVCLTRLGCLNLASWYNSRFNINENDVYAYYPSVGFVVHLNMFYAVYAGACVDIVPESARLDMKKLNAHFIKKHVTHTFLTSRVAEDFFTTQNNNMLKFVQKGGEKLEEFPYYGNTFIFEGYGASETNAASVYCPKTQKNVSSCIGYPLANTNVYILDDTGKRVPTYAVGELCIAGNQVANCYLNDEELTKKVFVDNPFCRSNSKYYRMFKTGDFAYIQDDGKIINVGRRDSTIKIRGNRVELSEIELQIKKLNWINSVAVRTIKNNNNNELVAYITLQKDADKRYYDSSYLFDVITEYIAKNKPNFMVPSYVIRLDNIPLNLNGKIDSKKLPKPKLDKKRVKYVTPKNSIEKDVCSAFSSVFKIGKISVEDDFILLGGDSLIAMKLLSILNKYNLSAVDFTKLKTPRKIAEKISRSETSGVKISNSYINKNISLSEQQLNVYLDIKIRDKKASYNIPIKIDYKCYSSTDIKKAINKVLDAHPILKMHLEKINEDICLKSADNVKIHTSKKLTKDKIYKFINESFNLENSLCRFLIDEDNKSLYAVFHHLIFDGLSTDIFFRDLSSALQGNKIKKEIEFVYHKMLEEKLKKATINKEAQTFYDDLFKDLEDVPDFMADVNVKRPSSIKRKLPINNKVIDNFVKDNGITKNVLFCSAFAYTLSRFTNSSNAYFTWTENGRSGIDANNAIGMFVNTLPVVINCDSIDTISFLLQCKDIIFKSQEYCFFPFRLLKNKYEIHNNINFQYRPYLTHEGQLEKNLKLKLLQDNDLISELSFNVLEDKDFSEVEITSSSKISKQTIERIYKVYQSVLSELLVKDKLEDINYEIKSDIDLLNKFNNTKKTTNHKDIIDAFDCSVNKYPNNIFVKSCDDKFTYSESKDFITALSNKLYKKSKTKTVAIFTHRSCYYALGAMSILNCGYAYVPIDDTYPDERIKFILQNSCSDICIVSKQTASRAKKLTSMPMIVIDEIKTTAQQKDIKCKYSEEQPAIVLYTSGSTGQPKGAVLPRRSILSFADWCADKTKLKSSDSFAMYCSFGFDVHAEALFSAAYVGASVDIVPADIRTNFKELVSYFEINKITHVELSTAITKLLFTYRIPKTLKYLLTGGEALGNFNKKTNCQFYDTYGPTEAMVSVSYVKISDKIDPSCIGSLTSNTKAYVLDKERRIVPFGAPGELYLAGKQLAIGYLGDDAITNSDFVKNPYSNDNDYVTLYRTGDIVRFLPDNTLGFVGRKDSQIKIRGNRVELGEVEAAISEINEIKDVVVVAVKNDGVNELVAYVVSKGNNIKDKIRSYIEDNKPSYMVPSHIVLLSEIPLNANMKVDRRKLPKIKVGANKEKYIAPKTEKQVRVCNVFKKLFSVDKIGLNDDFVSLGGDSLQAIKLSGMLGVDNLSPSDIFELKTPLKISEKLDNNAFKDINEKRYKLSDKIPLSEQQLNVYLDIVSNNMKDSYLLPFKIKIPDYSISAIKKALNECIEAHPILSYCIDDSGNTIAMKKRSKPKIEIVNKDNKTFFKSFTNIKFNLNDTLGQFFICKDTHNLYGLVHHIVFDGLSINNFCNDIVLCLEGKKIAKDTAFLRSAAFSEAIKNTKNYKEAEKYYENLFCNAEELPSLLEDVNVKCGSYTSRKLNFDSEKISDCIQENKITKNIFFAGAFAYTLSRFTNSQVAQFSLIDNGRQHINAFDSVGMFVNTIPIYIDCGNEFINKYFSKVKDKINHGLKYDFYPYRSINKKFGINNSIDFQYYPDSENNIRINKDDEFFTEEYFQRNDFINDFSFVIKEHNNSFVVSIECSNKISAATANNFISVFENIVQGFLKKDQLKDIQYCPQDNILKFNQFNKTKKKIKFNDILEAFNKSCEKHPNSCFVRYKDLEITYKKALYFVNNLSSLLTNKSKTSKVAIFTERSHYYALASLAVLNQGCAYVPIDDTYPDRRIKYIIKNSDADVVIVSNQTVKRAKKLTNAKLINIDNVTFAKRNKKLNVDFKDKLPAIILYTSGSTGKPKGAVLPRKSILSFADWCAWKTKLKPKDCFAMYCSFGFDVHAEALFSSLYVGATLDIIPNELRTDLGVLVDYLEQHNVTHIELSTAITKLLFTYRLPKTFKYLLTGGEALGDFREKTNCKFFDTYGPTEAMVSVSYVDIASKSDPSSIGYLTSNTKAYILDDEHRLVPFGAPGRLFISGYQLANEYLKNKKATKLSFIKNEFSNEDGHEILYDTGDEVRFLPDLSLGFIGRKDSQFKIRGNRIELGEVEAAIRKLKDIKDVTVQVRNNNGVNELVAYVVSDNVEIKDAINNYIKQNKPTYMIPSHILTIDKIPLNANMKVDKALLPKVNFSQEKKQLISPSIKEEKQICKAFEETLNIENIGLYDDFVSLGGDSISAIRLSSMLAKINLDVKPSKILELRTPFKISKIVKNYKALSYKKVSGYVDPSPIQKYYFDTINNDKYVQYFVLKSNSTIDYKRLQNAVDELTFIQDNLRSQFTKNAKVYIPSANKSVVKIKNIKAERISNKLLTSQIIDSISKISLKDNHLIDIKLINNEYIVFVMHHLIVDGVSWTIIANDLFSLYNKYEVNRPFPYSKYFERVKVDLKKHSSKNLNKYKEMLDAVDEQNLIGKPMSFTFELNGLYPKNNYYSLSESDFLLLAVSRAYKATYGQDAYFEMESHGRASRFGDANNTAGWYTSVYPIKIKTNNSNDEKDIIYDMYNMRAEISSVKDLGLEYLFHCYITKKLKYKHMPISFNFLSDEFEINNNLFNSYVLPDKSISQVESYINDDNVYGMELNITKVNSKYCINGLCAKNTYLHKEHSAFLNNINKQIRLIRSAISKNIFMYPLNEEQSMFYLDEKMNRKDSAYSCFGFVEIKKPLTEKFAKSCIDHFIEQHPVLKTRVIDSFGEIYAFTDASPDVLFVRTKFSKKFAESFIMPFDLSKSAVRFNIVFDKNKTYIIYDMHHIISDASSQIVIDKELYDLFNDNKKIYKDLGFLNKAIADFDDKHSFNENKANEYYQNKYSESDKFDDLIEDKNNVYGGLYNVYIEDIKSSVEELADKLSVTQNSILMSTFAYTMSRFTHSDKAYFTFTNHGRQIKDYEKSLGMFAKILPIVVDTENQNTNDFIKHVTETMFEAINYSAYPFSKLANEYMLNKKVCFEYNNTLNDLNDIQKYFGYFRDKTKFEAHPSQLLAVINDYKNGYVFSLEHSHHYNEQMIKSFGNTFVNVLKGLLNTDKLSDIQYTKNSDIQLFNKINLSRNIKWKYNDIIDAFLNNVKKHPDKVCVCDKANNYTYSEVDKITNKLALIIKKHNISINDLVSFITDRSFWYPVCMITLLKLGVSYVPIDKDLPSNRIGYILKDANVKACLVTKDCLSIIAKADKNKKIDWIILDQNLVNKAIKENSTLNFNSDTINNDTCAVVYTSGTTGKPKGVCVNRKGVLNLATWYKSVFKINTNDVYGYYSSIGFVVHLQIFYALYAGACVDVIPDDVRFDMGLLNDYCKNHNITHIFLTSRVAEEFFTKYKDNKIKVAQKGGEKVEEFFYDGKTYIFEGYGATETGAASMYCPKDQKRLSSEIGYPVSNLHAYLIDKEGRRVPKYALGELCIGGVQVANGYLNDPKTSKEVFVKNNIEAVLYSDRMYKTGDFAYYLEDGSIVNVGRRDSLIKISGNRVSLSEIEECVNKLPAISTSNVSVLNKDNNSYVVAYVVLNKDYEDYKNNGHLYSYVSDHVAKEKPNYMVPTFVVPIEKIPLNLNGKVDRKKLPEPSATREDSGFEKPTSKIQILIADCIAKVMNIDIDQLSINDNLIILGLNSLTCIKILSEFNKQKLAIDARLMLKNPTIKQWEQIIVDNENKAFKHKKSGDNLYPLTDSALFVYDLLDNMGNIPVYNAIFNTPKAFVLKNKTEKEIISAIYKALDIHEAFKSTLVKKGDNIYIKKRPKWRPVIKVERAKTKPNFELFSKLQIPFKLIGGDLFRAWLFKWNKDIYAFFDVHHIITDGTSNEIFFSDVLSILNDEAPTKEDINVFQQANIQVENYKQKLNKEDNRYFKKLSKGYTNSDFPKKKNWKDTVKRKLANNEDYDYGFIFNEYLYKDIKAYSDKLNVSVSNLFLSFIIHTYQKVFNVDKVMILSIESGRKTSDLANVCGCLFGLFPVIHDGKDKDFTKLLNKINEQTTNSYMYDFSYRGFKDKIINSNIFYNYHAEFEEKYSSHNDKYNNFASEIDAAMNINMPFNISFSVDSYDLQISISAVYRSEIYDKDSILKFMKELDNLIIKTIKK